MFRPLLRVSLLVAVQVTALAEDSNNVADTAVENIDRLLQDSWDRGQITPAPPAMMPSSVDACGLTWRALPLRLRKYVHS